MTDDATGRDVHPELDLLADLDAGVDVDHLRAQATRELPRLRAVAEDVFARWAKLL